MLIPGPTMNGDPWRLVCNICGRKLPVGASAKLTPSCCLEGEFRVHNVKPGMQCVDCQTRPDEIDEWRVACRHTSS